MVDRSTRRVLIFFAGRQRNARESNQRPGLIAAQALKPDHVLVLYPDDDAIAQKIARELVEDIASDATFTESYWRHRVIMVAVPSKGVDLEWRRMEPCVELVRSWLKESLAKPGELVFEREKAVDDEDDRFGAEAFSLANFSWAVCGLSGTLAAQVALTRALEECGADIEVVYSNEDRPLTPRIYRPEAHLVGGRSWRDRIARMRHLPVNSLLLLRGETGVGKSYSARWLHELWHPTRDKQARGRFVHINCAAIPAELLEAELFGARKGAFTGAIDRPGAFVEANGGTLFLDEIGELDLALQAKLLVVLDTDGVSRRITPVGGGEARETDARILLGTNRDLEAMVEEGTFRADLLARIRDHEVTLPPLRTRRHELFEALLGQLEGQLMRYRKNPHLEEIELVVISHTVRRYLEQLFMDARNTFPLNHRTVRALCERAMFEAFAERIDEGERRASTGDGDEGQQEEHKDTSPRQRLDLDAHFLPTLEGIASSLVTRSVSSTKEKVSDHPEHWLGAAREQRLRDAMGEARYEELSILERIEAAVLLEALEEQRFFNRAWEQLEQRGWVRETSNTNKSDVFRKRYQLLFGRAPQKS